MSERLQFIGISVLVIVGGLAAIVFSGYDDRWRLRARGVETEAGILKLWSEFRELSPSSEAGAPNDLALIRFTDLQGKHHTLEIDLPGRLHHRLKTTGMNFLPVVYDPLNPALCVAKGEEPGSALAVLFGLGLILLGGYMLRTDLNEETREPDKRDPTWR